MLEVEAGGQGGERFIEEGALPEGVDFHLVEGGVIDPHGVAVADGGAGAGGANFAPEFIRDAEVDLAFADDRFVEEVGGALLGEGGFEVRLFCVDVAQFLEEGGTLPGGELRGGAGGEWQEQRQSLEAQCQNAEAGGAPDGEWGWAGATAREHIRSGHFQMGT